MLLCWSLQLRQEPYEPRGLDPAAGLREAEGPTEEGCWGCVLRNGQMSDKCTHVEEPDLRGHRGCETRHGWVWKLEEKRMSG